MRGEWASVQLMGIGAMIGHQPSVGPATQQPLSESEFVSEVAAPLPVIITISSSTVPTGAMPRFSPSQESGFRGGHRPPRVSFRAFTARAFGNGYAQHESPGNLFPYLKHAFCIVVKEKNGRIAETKMV